MFLFLFAIPLVNSALCSTEINKSTVHIKNDVLTATGPNNCNIPLLYDTSELYRGLKNKWIVSAGGSAHWGTSMNLLRMFSPLQYPTKIKEYVQKSTWNFVLNGQGMQVPPITEVYIYKNGNRHIYTSVINRYECLPMPLLKLTIIHTHDLFDIYQHIRKISNKCRPYHHPKPDLVIDFPGRWYKWCLQGISWACKPPKWSKRRKPLVPKNALKTQYNDAKNIFALEYNTILLVGYEKLSHKLQSLAGNNFLLQTSPIIDKKYKGYQNHPSNAVSTGIAMIFIFKLMSFNSIAVLKANISASGCTHLDAQKKNLYHKRPFSLSTTWEAPFWQQCEIKPVYETKLPKKMLYGVKYTTGFGERFFWSTVSVVIILFFFLGAFSNPTFTKYRTVFESLDNTPKNILGIGGLRFLASLHITIGHLQRRGTNVMSPILFGKYGYTWVPWFMILSGFVLTWSLQKENRRPKHPLAFLYNRLKGIYPLYLTGLLISYNKTIPLKRLCIDILLIQSWNPMWTEQSIMPHTWFLSTIIIFWALHHVIYNWVILKKTSDILKIMLVVFMLSFLSIFVDMRHHSWGEFESLYDSIVIMLKFHPIFYFPMYLCGVCGGCLAYRVSLIEKRPYIIKYGTIIGATCLCICFTFSNVLVLSSAKLGFRIGMLMPIHILMLLGLALGTSDDIIRVIFRHFSKCGKISYAQYIFQFIWFKLWGARLNMLFFSCCIANDILLYTIVDKPMRTKKWLKALGGILVVVCGIKMLQTSHLKQHIIGMDSILGIHSITDSDDMSWINPSLVWYNKSIWMSSRRLRNNGNDWESDIGLVNIGPEIKFQSINMDIYHPKKHWSCKDKYKYTRGIEDIRLFVYKNRLKFTGVNHRPVKQKCLPQILVFDKNSDNVDKAISSELSNKNWMYMENGLFMTNVSTQKVVQWTGNGSYTYSILKYPNTKNWHGGGNLISTYSVFDKRKIWLGIVHSPNNYKNHLVEFEHRPPYKIRRIGRELRLYSSTNTIKNKTGFAFASGILLDGEKLVITYGVSNTHSRIRIFKNIKDGFL